MIRIPKVNIMKKIMLKSLSVLLTLVFLTAQSFSLSAGTIAPPSLSVDESVFDYDHNALEAAFYELNELDSYLEQNEGLSYEDLQAAGNILIAGIGDISTPLGLPADGDELPLGIPAFWWGCVLGWVGLLVVYVLTDKDKDQTKKALTGCLISTGAGVVLSVVYYVWILGAVNDL